MRKLLSLFILMVSMFIFVACQDEPELDIVTTEILNQIQIEFDEGDQTDHVTQNINLTISLDLFENVEITWITSDSNIITLDAGVGVVSRQAEDAEVTLTAEVKLNLDTKYKYFNLVVKAASSIDVPDEVAPVISGASDFNLALDSSAPDWLLGVSATDDVDGTVIVTADASQVDLNTVGVYDLIYTATDKAGNTSTVTVKVTVEAEVLLDTTKPVITGTHDFEYKMGDDTPNYLLGVTATDDVDGEVLVSVDDSEVDLTTPGNYDLIYTATDAAGNVDIKIVTIYVFEDSFGEDGETYVETFAGLGLSGSSYVSGTYKGVNDVNWTYSGARGDQDVNGKALTFGGASKDNSYLKATIEDGIQFISLKHRQPFGGSQQYGIYINGELITQFMPSTTIESVEYVFDTPVTDTFTLEIKPVSAGTSRSQGSIDDLTWISAPRNKKPVEQQNAESDKDTLSIQTTFIEDTTLNFNHVGLKGSAITWNYFDDSNPHNHAVNLTTGAVVIPENGSYQVLVSATITNGIYSFNKIFELTIGEGHPIDIEQARNLNNDDYVKTSGVITTIYHHNQVSYIFIEDLTGGILVQAPTSLGQSLVVGQFIEVKGSKQVENNFIIIHQVRGIVVTGSGDVTPEVTTADKLYQYQARLVTVSGLITKNYSVDTSSFEFLTLDGKFSVLIPNGVSQADVLNIQSKLTGLDIGTEVTLSAPVVRMGNQYVLYITHPDQIEVAQSVFFNDVADIIKDNLSIPNFEGTISNDLTLTNSSELVLGATITWESSNTSVLSHNGVIYQSDTEVQVTLTYTVLFDGELVESKSIVITIASLTSYTGYYAVLANKSGQALKTALTNLIRNTGIATNSTGSTANVKYVDKYNGQNYNIYTGFGAYGNREHVWPNSQLGSRKYDLHNLRAAVTNVNSTRSNFPFTNQVTGTQWQKVGSTFYPGSEHVGDVARIVLYISIFENLSLNRVGRFSNLADNIQMFVDWHEQDEVSDFELSRNGKIFEIQSNRNPFIDHPELVDVMFS